MADEKWSEWIDYSGEGQPVPNGVMVEVTLFGGSVQEISPRPSENWCWEHIRGDSDIIAYRYRIKENEMHPDLECLARNVSEWPKSESFVWIDEDGEIRFDNSIGHDFYPAQGIKGTGTEFVEGQWLQARKDLGLIMTEAEEELPAEEWAGGAPEVAPINKQLRYMDAKGEDWIDEFARTATVDEFRGAMRFTIGKYNRRAGKKDELIKEVEKMRDYCDRWIAYEKARA